MLAGDSASHAVAGLIFNGLVKYDKDLTLTGDLAESWDVSKDGLVITFHLKRGVKWTDGVEFTAEDVMFGYKTIIDDKTPTAYSEDYKQVKRQRCRTSIHFVSHMKNHLPLHSAVGKPSCPSQTFACGKDITKSDGPKPCWYGTVQAGKMDSRFRGSTGIKS